MARGSGRARWKAWTPVRPDGPGSARMARRGRRPEWQVRSAFDGTRMGAQCLAAAYERLVPIPRRLARRPPRRVLGDGHATDTPLAEPRNAERG